MIALLKLARIRQWIKNIFVFAPLIFSGLFLHYESFLSATYAALIFCLASSFIYIINDVKDVNADRQHPVKSKKKPLASGTVSMSRAYILLSAIGIALVVCLLLFPVLAPVIIAYVTLNLAYTWVLKNQPVIDIFCIALGFVMRVYAGAVALAVPLSPWMFITTLSLALYLAAIKRRQELMISSAGSRKVLGQYNVALVDRYAEMSATGALVFYCLFVVTTNTQLVITVPFVLFGMFRYWYIVESKDEGESPTDALYRDWQLILTILLWSAISMWALWPKT